MMIPYLSLTYYYQAICPLTTILSGESGKIHYKWNILANHLD
jgi:hypothetical protein